MPSTRRQKEILAAHPSAGVLAFAAHAAEPAQASACVDATMERFGSVDVLVNNAGTNPHFGPLTELEPILAEKITRLNQFGPVLWTQLVWKAWMSEHGGAIVNVASLGGLHTELGIGYYNATKAALIHLTRQLAMEMAPSVRVNGVAPGIVRTHLAKALWENHEDRLRAALPLGRIGRARRHRRRHRLPGRRRRTLDDRPDGGRGRRRPGKKLSRLARRRHLVVGAQLRGSSGLAAPVRPLLPGSWGLRGLRR